MDGSLGAFAPHVIALLVGGLGTSLGATFWARTARAQERLVKLKGSAFTGAVLAVLILGPGTAFLIVRSIVSTAGADLGHVAPWQMLLLGISVGLPMGIPGIFATRSDAIRKERARQKLRDYVPTKDDRRAYAVELADQIKEFSPQARQIAAEIAGDGGTVLRFEGDIDATEGERLAKALRDDLRGVGFKRLEGKKGSREWWTRV